MSLLCEFTSCWAATRSCSLTHPPVNPLSFINTELKFRPNDCTSSLPSCWRCAATVPSRTQQWAVWPLTHESYSSFLTHRTGILLVSAVYNRSLAFWLLPVCCWKQQVHQVRWGKHLKFFTFILTSDTYRTPVKKNCLPSWVFMDTVSMQQVIV